MHSVPEDMQDSYQPRKWTWTEKSSRFNVIQKALLMASVKESLVVSRPPSKGVKQRWDSKHEIQTFPSPESQDRVGVLRF